MKAGSEWKSLTMYQKLRRILENSEITRCHFEWNLASTSIGCISAIKNPINIKKIPLNQENFSLSEYHDHFGLC